jgi:hypothetical protein
MQRDAVVKAHARSTLAFDKRMHVSYDLALGHEQYYISLYRVQTIPTPFGQAVLYASFETKALTPDDLTPCLLFPHYLSRKELQRPRISVHSALGPLVKH